MGFVKKIFGGDEPSFTPPPVLPSPVMPTADDEAVKRARKKSLAAQYRRRGRSSTILSDAVTDSEKLGG